MDRFAGSKGLAVWSQNDQGQYRIFGAVWLSEVDPRGGQWGPTCRPQTGDGSQIEPSQAFRLARLTHGLPEGEVRGRTL
jgi:hypothetical protein